MGVSSRERDVLRRLAGEVAEIAALPVQADRTELWRRLNRLESVRPLVWINEVCWDEMGPEVEPTVSEPFLREVEAHLRRTLYQWRHLPADMVVDGWIGCPIVVRDSGYGLETNTIRPEDFLKSAVDYVPTITSEADVLKIDMPVVTVDWEATDRRVALMEEVFAGVLPVRRVGVSSTWFAPWDQLIQWYGVQELYVDIYDRPELVQLAADRMVDAMLYKYDQYERLGVLELNNRNVRVGSGGLGITDELPQDDFDGEHVRMIDMWGNSAAQIFSEVSPAMHEQFALKYELRILERFGLNCYGCCEPLHRKIDLCRRIPRLRRISMSPFVNVAEAAESIGQDYVYSAKPNPAVLAANTWRPWQAQRELREILEMTRGLHVEIILKDIHTVRGQRQRLWEWARMAMEMVERYAA